MHGLAFKRIYVLNYKDKLKSSLFSLRSVYQALWMMSMWWHLTSETSFVHSINKTVTWLGPTAITTTHIYIYIYIYITTLTQRRFSVSIMTMWHFPHHCPIMKGMPCSLVDSPHNGLMMQSFNVGWINNRVPGDLRCLNSRITSLWCRCLSSHQ